MTGKDKNTVTVKKTDKYLEQVEDKNGKKWDIKIEKDAEATFEKRETDRVSTNEIDIKITEHGKNNYVDAKAKVRCSNTFWRETYKIEPEITGGQTVTLKEVKKNLSTDRHSFNWGFYTVGGVTIAALVAFIWYWVASSKSEDKEEESL